MIFERIAMLLSLVVSPVDLVIAQDPTLGEKAESRVITSESAATERLAAR